MGKIDIHLHCGAERKQSLGQSLVPSVFDVLDTVLVDEGASHAFLMATPILGGRKLDPTMAEEAYEASCAEARELASRYPAAFSWFCNFDPRTRGFTPETNLEPLLREYQDLGAIGFGEVVLNLLWDDPYVLNLLAALERVGLPILVHMDTAIGASYGLVDDAGLPRMERVLQAFPRLVVIGHSQVFWSEISAESLIASRSGYPGGHVIPGRLQYLLKEYPNLYADLSARSGYNALVRDSEYAIEFLQEFSHKLMYGSDYMYPRAPVRTSELLDELVGEGDISEAAYARIVRENAISVFDVGDKAV